MQVWLYVEADRLATPRRMVRFGRTLERYGFDGLLVAASPHHSTQDGWAAMAAVARTTRRLRLGVLLPPASLTSPRHVAEAAASLDRRSGGRFELGLAAVRAEPDPTRAPLPPMSEGFTRLDETLAVLTGLWWTPRGERFSFAGRYHTVLDSPGVAALQQPGPPLIVSGPGRRTTGYLAARWADEVNVPFRELDHAVRQYWEADDASARAGRGRAPLRRSVALTVRCDPSGAVPPRILTALGEYQTIGTARVYLRLAGAASGRRLASLARRVLPACHGGRAAVVYPPYPC